MEIGIVIHEQGARGSEGGKRRARVRRGFSRAELAIDNGAASLFGMPDPGAATARRAHAATRSTCARGAQGSTDSNTAIWSAVRSLMLSCRHAVIRKMWMANARDGVREPLAISLA